VPTAIYDYAVIRVVPRVEREEFINVGVVVSCHATGLLEAGIELDAARVRALDPHIDLDTLRAHLAAIATICRGGPGSGPIGALPARARFHWLTARRSSIIQMSPVHTGRSADPASIVETLLDRMVRVMGAREAGSGRRE
jgi:hypothetical protein